METTLRGTHGYGAAGIRLASLVALAVLLIPVDGAFAQQRSEVTPLDNPVLTCFQKGTGDQFMKVCITTEGNMRRFESPAGLDQMGGPEGYVVCYGPGGSTVAYDNGAFGSGWKPSVSTGTGFNRTITRVTTDGKLQWKQVFSADQIEKDVTIKVELKNVSNAPIFVQGFARYFDDHTDNSYANDIADKTGDSVTSREVNGLASPGSRTNQLQPCTCITRSTTASVFSRALSPHRPNPGTGPAGYSSRWDSAFHPAGLRQRPSSIAATDPQSFHSPYERASQMLR
jgi:hypothetical protein